MLANELRPITWDEVSGQKANVNILKAIVRRPDSAPRSLIFSGVFGSGKTTCARILARELNNEKGKFDLEFCPFYAEYDSTIIGNVDKIRELRDSFMVGAPDKWNIVVFDEAHAVSTQAQTALLKVIEEVRERTFFIFCTTHVNKVLPTIRSRSLELVFSILSYEETIEHINKVSNRLEENIPEDIKSMIAVRSEGHVRDVNMLLDMYLIVGEQAFKESIRSCVPMFCKFFESVYHNDLGGIMESIKDLSYTHVHGLRADFANTIFNMMKCFSGYDVIYTEVKDVVGLYKGDVLKIVKHYFGEWRREMFNDDVQFSVGMLLFYELLKKEVQGKSNEVNLRDRAVIKR